MADTGTGCHDVAARPQHRRSAVVIPLPRQPVTEPAPGSDRRRERRSARAAVHPDVRATLSIVAEIMVAQRRRTAGHDSGDVVKSTANKQGRDRATGRDPSPNPDRRVKT